MGIKGAVVNLEETNPKNGKANKKPKFKNPEDAIIYELHVRDLSIQPESGDKRKYLGVTEKGTKGPGGVKQDLIYKRTLVLLTFSFTDI